MYDQGRKFRIPSTLIGELSFLKNKKPNYYQIEDQLAVANDGEINFIQARILT